MQMEKKNVKNEPVARLIAVQRLIFIHIFLFFSWFLVFDPSFLGAGLAPAKRASAQGSRPRRLAK
jgi:hypothetical protein